MTCVLVERAESRRERLARAGRWLTAARERRGLTQRAVAAAIERSPQVLSTYERGIVQVPENLVEPLAKALEVSVTEIRQGLGLFVREEDLEYEDQTLRLPRGIKRSDLDPAQLAALESILDTFLDQVLRDPRAERDG